MTPVGVFFICQNEDKCHFVNSTKLTPDTPKGGYIRTVLGSGYKFNSSPF